MNFWSIFALILGEAEQIVPIFIHNPKSQAIEGIIVTTTNAALSVLANQSAAPKVPVSTPAPTTTNVTVITPNPTQGVA